MLILHKQNETVQSIYFLSFLNITHNDVHMPKLLHTFKVIIIVRMTHLGKSNYNEKIIDDIYDFHLNNIVTLLNNQPFTLIF